MLVLNIINSIRILLKKNIFSKLCIQNKIKQFLVLFISLTIISLFPISIVNAKSTTSPSNHLLKSTIKKMSLSQKVAQMYIIPSQGSSQDTLAVIKKYQPGGIILFGNDFKNQTKESLVDILKNYQLNSNLSLLIGTDQEGGTVSRLSTNPLLTDNQNFPSPQQLYQAGGQQAVVNAAGAVAKLLRSLQINLNFAPVADVSADKNSFIYSRTLGLNYQATAKCIAAEVRASQNQHIAISVKHFPGYGSAGDTHTGFASTDKSLKDFEKNDFLPFKAGIKAGAKTVLVSHIFVKSIDPNYPASLSPKVHQILRKKLHFKQVIITDDLSMGAITKFATDKHVSPDLLAVKAGNDMLLSNNFEKGIPVIVQAVENKEVSTAQINRSVYRILKLKRSLGILNQEKLKALVNN